MLRLDPSYIFYSAAHWAMQFILLETVFISLTLSLFATFIAPNQQVSIATDIGDRMFFWLLVDIVTKILPKMDWG